MRHYERQNQRGSEHNFDQARPFRCQAAAERVSKLTKRRDAGSRQAVPASDRHPTKTGAINTQHVIRPIARRSGADLGKFPMEDLVFAIGKDDDHDVEATEGGAGPPRVGWEAAAGRP